MRVYFSLIIIGLSFLLATASFGQSNEACERSSAMLDDMLDGPEDRPKIDRPGETIHTESIKFRWTKCVSSSSSTEIKSDRSSDAAGQDRAAEMKKQFERENRMATSQSCQSTENMRDFEIGLAQRNGVYLCAPGTAPEIVTQDYSQVRFPVKATPEPEQISDCVDTQGMTQLQKDAVIIKGQKICSPFDADWSKPLPKPTCRNADDGRGYSLRRAAAGQHQELPLCDDSEASDQSTSEIGE